MTDLLLDTHAFLWWVSDAPALSIEARHAIRDPETKCLLSLASCWEIAIKQSLGKLRMPAPLERFIPEQMAVNRFQSLEIDFRHVTRVAGLPFHHRDPFDRLLIAQALEEDLTLVSSDSAFDAYGVKRLW
jgi:PIN domain nuclease of toxin-antitoxin system